MAHTLVVGVLLACISGTWASVLPLSPVANALDSLCTNGPNTRACWSNGYSIATDYDTAYPTTGKTVTYDFVITNTTCNPDGHGTRLCMLINGQYPGPPIRANWGDTVVVNVVNHLQDNGTGIHFHGVRQLNSCASDGTNGITQCPIAPNNSLTYTFQATQYGTSWYHSHFTVQFGDGVAGPIIFDGPATANYDVDLGPYMIGDWYYQTAFQVNAIAAASLQAKQPPPIPDTYLINGANKNANGGGSYNLMQIQSGKRYRLRLINPSVDNFIRVSLDNHPFTIIAADFVPIDPITTNWVLLSSGQRYDVVFTANQTAGNYWFRAEPASDCQSSNQFYGRAIWTYNGLAVRTPNTTAFATPNTSCQGPSPLTPYQTQSVPSGSLQNMAQDLNVSFTSAQVVPGVGDAVVVWALSESANSINVDWANPTFNYLRAGNTSYPSRMDVTPLMSQGKWNYFLIQQASDLPPIAHPIHLHGHDFYVLGSGSTTWTPSAPLNYVNPTRRDTAILQGGGWLALAFVSNNPGAWLM